MINTSSTPLIQAGNTYTYTENLGGVQIVRYIHVDGPTRPNATTLSTLGPRILLIPITTHAHTR